jgi:predicted dehydrogenase
VTTLLASAQPRRSGDAPAPVGCQHGGVTRIAIVGSGRAATLHAEAVRAVPGLELVGIGGRSIDTATSDATATLATALETSVVPLEQMIKTGAMDGIVVAVPAATTAAVLDQIPAELPVLVESPGPLHLDQVGMTAANLLHASTVERALIAIQELGGAHHLELRSRSIRPRWGHFETAPPTVGVLSAPGAGLVPVLLAAAGTAVETVSATLHRDGRGTVVDATLRLGLTDGRTVLARLSWTDTESEAEAELEAASATGVAHLRLWPSVSLELDGRAVKGRDESPLVALGFVPQMQRFGDACKGERTAWPPISVGLGVDAISRAAIASAAADGAPVSPR